MGGSVAATGRGTAKRAPTDESLLTVARLVMDVSVRAADDVGGLSPVQLRALTALRRNSGANLAQLAEEMGVTVSTASRLVDRLVAADWVHRRPSASNRREISLSLSSAGKDVLRRYDDRRVGRLHECLDQVAPDRREAVIEALRELVHVVRP